MKRRLIPAAVIAGAAIAGCGASKAPAPTSSSPSPSTTTAVTNRGAGHHAGRKPTAKSPGPAASVSAPVGRKIRACSLLSSGEVDKAFGVRAVTSGSTRATRYTNCDYPSVGRYSVNLSLQPPGSVDVETIRRLAAEAGDKPFSGPGYVGYMSTSARVAQINALKGGVLLTISLQTAAPDAQPEVGALIAIGRIAADRL